jgi:hypothetical protein
MYPLYPLPRPEALKADQWCGPDGYLRELGRAELYRVDAAAVRVWRRKAHGSAHGLDLVRTERDLRQRYGAYVWFSLWAAMLSKASVAEAAPDVEARIAMRAQLARFIAWHVRKLLRHGRTIEGQQAGRELANLLYLSLVEPDALRVGEWAWSPREYCQAMNALFGVEHPFDDGTAIARHTARLEGYL